MLSIINMTKLQQMLSLNQTLRSTAVEIIYLHQIAGLLLSAYFLLFIYPKTGLDQTLIAPYFDIATQNFPLKHQVFLEKFMHTGLKYCMIFIAIACLLAGLQPNTHKAYRASILKNFIDHHQKQFILAFVGMVASTSVISLLKSISMHGCPNDLTLYGGELPLLTLFEHLPAGVAAGHCFPGGHASGGFALMAFSFAFREQKPKFAAVMLALALVLGFSMGWAQMLRGEHFLSHNLWTAWLMWLVLFVLFTLKTLIEKTKDVSNTQ
jgi:membrane-associated PAP2 superfamily phosphatase